MPLGTVQAHGRLCHSVQVQVLLTLGGNHGRLQSHLSYGSVFREEVKGQGGCRCITEELCQLLT